VVRSTNYRWGAHEPAVAAYLAATGGGLPAATIRALDKFVRKGRRDGWWPKIAEIYPFCGPTLAASLVPLKRVDGSLAPLTNNSFVAGDYSESVGFGHLDINNTKYLDTGRTFAQLGLSATNFSMGGTLLDAGTAGAQLPYLMSDQKTGGDVNFYMLGEGFGPSTNGVYNAGSGLASHLWTGNASRHLNVQSGVTGYRYSTPASFTAENNLIMLRRPLASPQGAIAKIGMMFYGSALTETEAKSLSLALLAFERSVRTIPFASSKPWLFVGNSISYKNNATTTLNSFTHLIAAGRSRIEYNFGLPSSATTFDQGPSNAILGLNSRYQDILQHDAEKAIIEYGVNDAQQDSSTNGDGTKTATYQAGLTTILQAFAARYGAANVYMLSTFWRQDKNSTFNTLWNNAMAAAASAAGVGFIDFYSYFVSQGSPAGWVADTVHGNNTGYINMSNYALTIV